MNFTTEELAVMADALANRVEVSQMVRDAWKGFVQKNPNNPSGFKAYEMANEELAKASDLLNKVNDSLASALGLPGAS